MAKIDLEFCKLISTILTEGKDYIDKNRNVTRKQIPSYTFRHEFKDGFPAITVKELFWKGIIGELLWFLKGDTNTQYLVDNNIHIWDKDALWFYNKQINGEFYGNVSMEQYQTHIKSYSVGKNYSYQWRSFNGIIDQISNLINNMINNIMSTYLIVTAWNPSELSETALAPCHYGFQIIGVPLEDETFGFELHWKQRSCDTFLGIPFNISSYAALAKILEMFTGYKALAIQGDLKAVHLYENQFEVANELLKRDPNKFDKCELSVPVYLSSNILSINEKINTLNINDFQLIGYESYDKLKVEMMSKL